MADNGRPLANGLPQWGYHPSEPARIFKTGSLPPGWSATPLKGQHPHDVFPNGLVPDGWTPPPVSAKA